MVRLYNLIFTKGCENFLVRAGSGTPLALGKVLAMLIHFGFFITLRAVNYLWAGGGWTYTADYFPTGLTEFLFAHFSNVRLQPFAFNYFLGAQILVPPLSLFPRGDTWQF